MNNKKLHIFSAFLIVITTLLVFFTSCKKIATENIILITQTKETLQNANYINENNWRFIPNSRIVSLNLNNPEKSLKVLTDGFFSAGYPQISFNGNYMVFAAQKKQYDVWQIWEMNLKTLKVKQITSSKENCTDPAYLPNGRVLFSKLTTIDGLKNEYALFSCNSNGSKISQITFNPHNYFASTILKDGRVLTISKELYPKQKDRQFLVLRPDGTKETLFYKGLAGSVLQSRGRETDNGKVVFIESDSTKKGGQIISIAYSHPLHSKKNLTAKINGDFHSTYPWKGDSLLVTYRSHKENNYAIYSFNSKTNKLGQVIYKDNNYNIVDAVVIKKQEKPKNLPSEVNISSNTGLLLCQDINFTESLISMSKAVKLEILGINTSYGTVAAENDGSFYLKVLADTPFRIQTIDINGKVVGGPSSWMYLRPGERRGCVGCHENPEQVPENRQPLSVNKNPIIPMGQFKEINKKVH